MTSTCAIYCRYSSEHQRFAAKYRLPFPLLSDPDAALAKAYGVYKQKSLYGRFFLGVERTTFLIDPQGRIARIFPKVRVEGHTEQVLEALQEAGKAATMDSWPHPQHYRNAASFRGPNPPPAGS